MPPGRKALDPATKAERRRESLRRYAEKRRCEPPLDYGCGAAAPRLPLRSLSKRSYGAAAWSTPPVIGKGQHRETIREKDTLRRASREPRQSLAPATSPQRQRAPIPSLRRWRAPSEHTIVPSPRRRASSEHTVVPSPRCRASSEHTVVPSPRRPQRPSLQRTPVSSPSRQRTGTPGPAQRRVPAPAAPASPLPPSSEPLQDSSDEDGSARQAHWDLLMAASDDDDEDEDEADEEGQRYTDSRDDGRARDSVSYGGELPAVPPFGTVEHKAKISWIRLNNLKLLVSRFAIRASMTSFSALFAQVSYCVSERNPCSIHLSTPASKYCSKKARVSPDSILVKQYGIETGRCA
ncbi:hypothetical protein C8R46DRAFT_1205585 [Mycena filopes]|nr:hypothetical protein C8R46DRAFT_1205585 [Mycena filopes]